MLVEVLISKDPPPLHTQNPQNIGQMNIYNDLLSVSQNFLEP